MSDADHLRALQRVLGRALVGPDPEAELTAAAAGLPEHLTALLCHVDHEGLQIARLLVARLRFERLMHGSRRAMRLFERAPELLTRRFRDYHADVPPTASDPWGEAESFEGWLRKRRGAGG